MQAPEPEDALWPVHVLVVEDEPLIRAMLADELREAGFNVVEAASADEALAYMQVNRDIGLVFSDIQMPGSLDGIGLAATLRAGNPMLPVILTSGNIVPEALGDRDAFLPKPYRPVDAVSLVFRTLDIAPRGRQA